MSITSYHVFYAESILKCRELVIDPKKYLYCVFRFSEPIELNLFFVQLNVARGFISAGVLTIKWRAFYFIRRIRNHIKQLNTLFYTNWDNLHTSGQFVYKIPELYTITFRGFLV